MKAAREALAIFVLDWEDDPAFSDYRPQTMPIATGYLRRARDVVALLDSALAGDTVVMPREKEIRQEERERAATIAEGWRAAFKYKDAISSNEFDVRNATCNNIARAIRRQGGDG